MNVNTQRPRLFSATAAQMLTLLATSVVGTTIQADGFRYTLIKKQSECNSNDLWLGMRSLKSCAEECARRRR